MRLLSRWCWRRFFVTHQHNFSVWHHFLIDWRHFCHFWTISNTVLCGHLDNQVCYWQKVKFGLIVGTHFWLSSFLFSCLSKSASPDTTPVGAVPANGWFWMTSITTYRLHPSNICSKDWSFLNLNLMPVRGMCKHLYIQLYRPVWGRVNTLSLCAIFIFISDFVQLFLTLKNGCAHLVLKHQFT